MLYNLSRNTPLKVHKHQHGQESAARAVITVTFYPCLILLQGLRPLHCSECTKFSIFYSDWIYFTHFWVLLSNPFDFLDSAVWFVHQIPFYVSKSTTCRWLYGQLQEVVTWSELLWRNNLWWPWLLDIYQASIAGVAIFGAPLCTLCSHILTISGQ